MRAVARLVGVLGAVLVGLLLFRSAPRELELVYDLSRVPGATGVEVTFRRGDELVRRAELKVPPGARSIRHGVRLSDGAYQLQFRIAAAGGPVADTRPLEVTEAGTIVLPLGP